jgi:hypothetical protein
LQRGALHRNGCWLAPIHVISFDHSLTHECGTRHRRSIVARPVAVRQACAFGVPIVHNKKGDFVVSTQCHTIACVERRRRTACILNSSSRMRTSAASLRAVLRSSCRVPSAESITATASAGNAASRNSSSSRLRGRRQGCARTGHRSEAVRKRVILSLGLQWRYRRLRSCGSLRSFRASLRAAEVVVVIARGPLCGRVPGLWYRIW